MRFQRRLNAPWHAREGRLMKYDLYPSQRFFDRVRIVHVRDEPLDLISVRPQVLALAGIEHIQHPNLIAAIQQCRD